MRYAGALTVFAHLLATWLTLPAWAQTPTFDALRSSRYERSVGPRPIFRSGTELVALSVVVTNPAGQFATDLARADFEVLEDGVLQDALYFSAGDVPLDLTFLMDTSAGMGDKLPMARRTGRTAQDAPTPRRASIVGFSNRVRVAQTWTANTEALLQGINLTAARGNTSLYDALYVTLRQFDRGWQDTNEVRRRAIVVLSDGRDTNSLTSLNDLLTTIRRSSVTIYTISLKTSTPITEIQAHQRRVADFEMRMIARETGVRAFFSSSAADLKDVYGVIAGELTHQYSLAYAPTIVRRDEAFRRVAVRIIDRPALQSRTRSGHLATSRTRAGPRSEYLVTGGGD